jgi:hypothetical protein
MVLYHYQGEGAAALMEGQGYRVARRGERFVLSGAPPTVSRAQPPGEHGKGPLPVRRAV